MQLFSHCVSCGHTRPQIEGRLLSCLMTSAAPSRSPSLIFAMKAGMFIPTGQPLRHRGFLQFRQRAASFAAVSASNPALTSSKLCARTSGAASLVLFLGVIAIIFYLRVFCTCVPLPVPCRNRRAGALRRNPRDVRRIPVRPRRRISFRRPRSRGNSRTFPCRPP